MAAYQMFFSQCLMLATRWRRAPAFIKAHWAAVTLNRAFELEFRKRLKKKKKRYPFAHQNLQCVNMKHWSLSINCDCFISLHLTASPPLCCGGAGVSSTCLWAKAGSHPGRAASLSQGRRATEQDKQQHTYDQFSQTSSQSSASRARFWTVDLIAVSANHYRHVTNAVILQLLDFYFIALLSLLLVS